MQHRTQAHRQPGVLVTGGAGYIGAHTAHQLLEAGFRVVIVDNLYSGFRWAIPRSATFYEGDAGDAALVQQIMARHDIAAVIHFAGHIVVPESVEDPLKYYRNNAVVSQRLISACLQSGVGRFIFSSSAAVYGIPRRNPVAEDAATAPINPYGTTKLITEWMLRDVADAPSTAAADDGFRYVALRYFNVAGARLDGTLGQATPAATHLIKVACEAACGRRPAVTVFGTDYDTDDGTAIRDFIHVEDLAAAHVEALRYLLDGGPAVVLNCGYGHGFSVREVLACVRAVSGVPIVVEEGPRRAGDPPALIADSRRIRELLGWRPRFDDLEVICGSAYRWEQHLGDRIRAGSAAVPPAGNGQSP